MTSATGSIQFVVTVVHHISQMKPVGMEPQSRNIMLIKLMYKLDNLDPQRERLFLFSGKTTGSCRDSLGVWVLLGMGTCPKYHHSLSFLGPWNAMIPKLFFFPLQRFLPNHLDSVFYTKQCHLHSVCIQGNRAEAILFLQVNAKQNHLHFQNSICLGFLTAVKSLPSKCLKKYLS